MHQTEFTRRVAASLDDGLPIPSHDTILWYVADRSSEFEWGATNLKKRGALKIRSLHKLKETARTVGSSESGKELSIT